MRGTREAGLGLNRRLALPQKPASGTSAPATFKSSVSCPKIFMPQDKTPLRVGLAGLGTVGSAVARILATRRMALSRIAGREIVLAGVSARDRTRDRGTDLGGVAWFDDPVALAAAPQLDVVVELIGGEEGAAESDARNGDPSRQGRRDGEQGLARQAWHRAREGGRKGSVFLSLSRRRSPVASRS